MCRNRRRRVMGGSAAEGKKRKVKEEERDEDDMKGDIWEVRSRCRDEGGWFMRVMAHLRVVIACLGTSSRSCWMPTLDAATCICIALSIVLTSAAWRSSLDHGRGMIECMNLLSTSHCCFGNHECDVPHEVGGVRVRGCGGAMWHVVGSLAGAPALAYSRVPL